jgi:hypothetical protein
LVGNLLSEGLELSVEFGTSSSFFLFLFEFFLVAKSMSSLPVARLIKGHVRRVAIELHIFGLALANDDGVLEVDVDDDDQFANTRLEE